MSLSGLVNLGNTCYFNSALQCLIHTKDLTEYFLSLEYRDDINKEELKGNGQLVSQAYYNLVKGLTEEQCIVRPNSFKRIIDILSVRFRGSRQHDSHECLIFILDFLHSSLSYNVKMELNITPPLSNASIKLEQQAFNDYKNYYKDSYSKIVELFHGQFCTVTHCPKCAYASYNFDPFICIPLDLHENLTTLESCLSAYTNGELLDNDNLWKCDNCKEEVRANRQTKLWKVPKYLIIQLKRFNKQGNKLMYNLQFPERLNIKEYVHNEKNSKYKYDLYGISNHTGGLNGGHYFSYCKVNNNQGSNWYNFNDAGVSKIERNSIVTPNAYLLFYRLL